MTTYTDNNKGVEVTLEPGESILAEPSAFCYSDGFIEAKTTTGGIMSAVKKLVTKEKLFQVLWQNKGNKPGRIGFASPYLSTIEEVEISPDYSLIAQRGAWLASDPTVKLDITMNLGLSGFLGGEGIIFQKFTGRGRVFITAGGDLKAINLERGESLNVDTGCIVGFADSVKYEIKLAGGIFTSIFGGEGLVLAKLFGPGIVILQTHPENVINKVVSSSGSTQVSSNYASNIDLSDGLQANELGAIARNLFGNRQ
ncbi:TIGR00266 family protein [Pleurocapsa sp. FMAR1]|uniref:TIGR00266 family protein n=1 Tax=Pleurocapsa sp. FMAR1 TaxID=3040204 RepID=UPI0029C9732E|nr:TIGR00266 family protein [Pleurocapsa sp. FMAR1]